MPLFMSSLFVLLRSHSQVGSVIHSSGLDGKMTPFLWDAEDTGGLSSDLSALHCVFGSDVKPGRDGGRGGGVLIIL